MNNKRCTDLKCYLETDFNISHDEHFCLNLVEVVFGKEGFFVDEFGICKVAAQEECNNYFEENGNGDFDETAYSAEYSGNCNLLGNKKKHEDSAEISHCKAIKPTDDIIKTFISTEKIIWYAGL
ncbi:hypothetical protein DINM_007333 [Dirofilaria immitis]|nr:hypothetical protein [Dirofilaria immitis]